VLARQVPGSLFRSNVLWFCGVCDNTYRTDAISPRTQTLLTPLQCVATNENNELETPPKVCIGAK